MEKNVQDDITITKNAAKRIISILNGGNQH